MSYILDALQRAEAERARGGVPTLHARPLAGPPLQHRLGTPQRAGLVIAVVVALCGAALAWWVWRTEPRAAVEVSAPAAELAVQLPAPAQLPAAALAETSQPQPLAAPAQAPSARNAAALAATSPTSTSSSKVKSPVLEALPAPSASKGKVTAVAPATAPTSPAPALAPLLSELPEATRSQIPAMAISGAVYSDNPAQRLLLVNGQVLNQGSQVAPDLTVVEIRSNSSEFSFRGKHFRMAH